MYSKEYLDQLKSLHYDRRRPQGFGGKVKDLGEFYNYMNSWVPNTCLDYGCGKGVILSHLRETYPQIKFEGYDPALEMWDHKPEQKFDLVFCNDVLEHIEIDFINDVLKDIDQYAQKYIWLRIDTMPARKKLPDGRNAHLIIKDKKWWSKVIDRNITGTVVYTEVNKKGKLDVAIKK